MKNTRWTLLAALVMATPAFAQTDPRMMSGSPSSPSTPGGSATGAATAGDSGVISNVTAVDSTTSSTTSEGIGPDGLAMTAEPGMEGMETTELANTGGAPLAMSLLGLSMAAGAFALRRRTSV